MDYDFILEKVYGNGHLPLLLNLLCSLQTIMLSFEWQSSVFMSYTPKFKCSDSSLINASHITWISEEGFNNWNNRTIPIPSFEQCWAVIRPTIESEKEVYSCESWSFDTNVMQRSLVTNFNLICGRKFYVYWLNSTVLMAAGLGQFLAVFTDSISRRKLMIFYMLWEIVTSCLLPFTTSLLAFMILRVVRVLGIPMVFMSSCIIQEIIPTKKRSIYANLFWFPYTFGHFLAAGLAYTTRDWQLLRLYSLPLMLAYIPLFFLMPESIRWLAVNGRSKELNLTLLRFAHWNRVQLSPTFMKESTSNMVKQCNEMEKSESTVSFIERNENIKSDNLVQTASQDSIFAIFRLPNMRKKMLVTLFSFSACNICYFGLSMNSSATSSNIFLNTCFQATSEMPATLIGWLMLKICGRRTMFVILYCLIAPALVIGRVIQQIVPIASTIILLFGKLSITIATNIAPLYLMECYPTTLRGMGLFLTMSCSYAMASLIPFINALETVYFCFPSIVLAVIALATAVLVYGFLPETNKCPLAQTLNQSEALVRGKEDEWIKKMKGGLL